MKKLPIIYLNIVLISFFAHEIYSQELSSKIDSSNFIQSDTGYWGCLGFGFYSGKDRDGNTLHQKVYKQAVALIRAEYRIDRNFSIPLDLFFWENIDEKKFKVGVAFGPSLKLRVRISSIIFFAEAGISIPGGVFWFDVPYGGGIGYPITKNIEAGIHLKRFGREQTLNDAVMFEVILR